eukprot:jgi/Mesen1/5370/ME000268S04566
MVPRADGEDVAPTVTDDTDDLSPSELLLQGARYGDMEDVEGAIIQGASVNSADDQGRTALHMAAANGHLAIVQYLLSQHAVVDVLMADNTPVDEAVNRGFLTILDNINAAMAVRGASGLNVEDDAA